MGTSYQPASGRPAQVLLAEEDKVSLSHLQDLLRKSGYDILVADDGLRAIEVLQSENPPALAILDWTMPGLSGIEICRRLREANQRRFTYVLLLTRWNQQHDRVAALESGADDCLYKPVDVRELRIRLQIGAQIILERALRESEERFRSAFECAGIGMAVVAVTGAFLQVKRAFCTLLGYTADELLGTDLHRVSFPDDSPTSQVLLQQFLAGEHRSGEFERKYATKSGCLVWTSSTVSVVLDSDDHPASFVLQVQDITERKAAAEALRRSEAFLREITDNAQDLILVTDLEFKFLYASPSFLSNLDYAPSALLGTDSRLLIHPDDQAGLATAAASVVENGQAQTITLRCRRKNGAWRHVEASRSLLRNASGVPEGFVVIARPLDDRILAEQRLQAAYAETELFLRSIPSILIGLDEEGCITRWNLTAATIFGLDAPAVLGRKFEECGIEWLHSDMKTEVAKWLSTKSSHRCEDLAYQHAGKTRFLGLRVQRIPANSDGKAGFIVTGADITQRKGLEEQLRQSQKLEAIGQLAAGIAHEINTPTQYVGDNTRFLKDAWASVAGFLNFCGALQSEIRVGSASRDLLQEFDQLYTRCDLEYLLKEIPRAIDQSLEGLQRVSKIVRGMKEFSHPGSEEKRAVNINKAIETTITVARHEWRYCAEVVTVFDESLPLVPCLIGEFNQVMLNLIINAAHAIVSVVGESEEKKGTITITTGRRGEWAEIAIADTGAGIPAEIRPRIFEPFFTTKEVGKGTGQGLALAHSVIVNRHQGKIWFDSESGKGTTFFIQLPLDTGTAAS